MYSSNEFTPPDLHPDYDWTNGLRAGDFSTQPDKLGGRLFEEILQASPEIGIELKRLAKLRYSDVHQHKLRSLIKEVFDSEYLAVLNKEAKGTLLYQQKRDELIKQWREYADRWYHVDGAPDTARIEREWTFFNEHNLRLYDEASEPKTEADPGYQFTKKYVHKYAEVIAYWCMADFSRYPECWYHEPKPKAPVLSLWEMERKQQEEEERIRKVYGPVPEDKVFTSRNVNKYGRPVKPQLTAAERAAAERQRLEQMEKDRQADAELDAMIKKNARSLRRKLDIIESNPRMVFATDLGADIIVESPTTAADLAVRFGRKKEPDTTKLKKFKRKLVIEDKPVKETPQS